MRAFVSVLVVFITFEIHGRHVGMSMKKIRQEVYNALKQDNLITSDQDATATDDDENFVSKQVLAAIHHASISTHLPPRGSSSCSINWVHNWQLLLMV